MLFTIFFHLLNLIFYCWTNLGFYNWKTLKSYVWFLENEESLSIHFTFFALGFADHSELQWFNVSTRLYESLVKQIYSPVELILVDNASSDGSVDFVKIHYPMVKVVQNSKNYMFARGNNEGIKIAQGEIICLINNDVEVAPDFLLPIVNAFQQMPEFSGLSTQSAWFT